MSNEIKVSVACVDCGGMFEKFSRCGRQVRCSACQATRERERKRINEQRRLQYGARKKKYMMSSKCYTVISDPDEAAALSRGAMLTRLECQSMLTMGHFTPGTVLKSMYGGPVIVCAGSPQKLKPIKNAPG